MNWAEDLRSAGVVTYKTERDVPYKEDRSKGPPSTGGYGTVSRATRSSGIPLIGEQQVYASKRIGIKSPEHQKEIAQEIKFLRQCQHRNIVQLEEAYIINHPNWAHNVYLVTKPWAQLSFQQFIERISRKGGRSDLSWFKPETLDPWPSIVRQCLEGLAYLHSEHPGFGPIRHKDIKPDNIVLHYEYHSSGKPEVRAIIIDFGISKEHVHGATTVNKGTYQYLGPEQIKNEDSKVKSRNPTLASDVFSLGCCFALIEGILRPWPKLLDVYEAAMGTGSCQFADNVTLINSILRDQQQIPAGPIGVDPQSVVLGFFCEQFRGLVRDMLKAEPSSRPSASTALYTIKEVESCLDPLLHALLLRKSIDSAEELDSKWRTDESLRLGLNSGYSDIIRRYRWNFSLPLCGVAAVKCVQSAVYNPHGLIVQISASSQQQSRRRASMYPSQPSVLVTSVRYLVHLLSAFGSDQNVDNYLNRYHGTDGQGFMSQLREMWSSVNDLDFTIAVEVPRVERMREFPD